jgi:hypothetical protein
MQVGARAHSFGLLTELVLLHTILFNTMILQTTTFYSIFPG